MARARTIMSLMLVFDAVYRGIGTDVSPLDHSIWNSPFLRVQRGLPRLLITAHKLPFSALPEAVTSNINEWRRKNPTFSFVFFNEGAQRSFMHKNCTVPNCGEAYDMLHSDVGRLDMFRIAFLQFHGGWWFDSGCAAGDIMELCGAKPEQDRLVVVSEPNKGNVRYMVIGAFQHPLLLANIYRVVSNVLRTKKTGKKNLALHSTGPLTMGRTLCEPFFGSPETDPPLYNAKSCGDAKMPHPALHAREVARTCTGLTVPCAGLFFSAQGVENEIFGAGSLKFRVTNCQHFWDAKDSHHVPIHSKIHNSSLHADAHLKK